VLIFVLAILATGVSAPQHTHDEHDRTMQPLAFGTCSRTSGNEVCVARHHPKVESKSQSHSQREDTSARYVSSLYCTHEEASANSIPTTLKCLTTRSSAPKKHHNNKERDRKCPTYFCASAKKMPTRMLNAFVVTVITAAIVARVSGNCLDDFVKDAALETNGTLTFPCCDPFVAKAIPSTVGSLSTLTSM
jgi:hypothetical protein